MTNSAGPEFVLGGRRNSTSMYIQGTYGLYWSSTAYSSATNAYHLLLNSSGGVNPAYNYGKYVGFSLRCLAEGRKGSSFSFPPTPSTNYSLTPLDQTLYQLAATALVPVCATKVRAATTGLVLPTLLLPALTIWAWIVAAPSTMRTATTSTAGTLSAA